MLWYQRDVLTNVDADFHHFLNGIYFSEGERPYRFTVFKKKVPFHPSGVISRKPSERWGIQSRIGYSFKIATMVFDFGQDYIHFHIPYGKAGAGVEGMTTDIENLLYSATPMGVQVSDQLGRVNFIFSKPAEGALDLKLGGSDFDTLYVSCTGRLFSRKINAKGSLPWQSPVKPPKPGL
jgi:hypothetical protein